MGRFAGEPDYALEWPPAVFVEELRRLLRRAQQYGTGGDWYDEVETLLRQAFTSPVPLADFKRALDSPTTAETHYDDEPF